MKKGHIISVSKKMPYFTFYTRFSKQKILNNPKLYFQAFVWQQGCKCSLLHSHWEQNGCHVGEGMAQCRKDLVSGFQVRSVQQYEMCGGEERPSSSMAGIWQLSLRFIYLFLLLFKYNCLHFSPTTAHHPSHPHLPPLIPLPLVLSMCP